MNKPPPAADLPNPKMAAGLEVFFIVLLFFVFGGWAAPEVNEPQYLGKAKHFWNPQWCPNDHFLSSADAHGAFFWTFGWVTQFCSLETTAWIGRFVGWTLLAIGWQRMVSAITSRFGMALLSAGIWVSLIDRCQMSGEWVIGGIEAKVFAYFFVLLACRSLLFAHWGRTFLWLGCASAFHVLVGGWSVLAAGMALLFEGKSHRPSFRNLAAGLVSGGLVACVGLVPAVWLSMGVSSDDAYYAARIYVFRRLQHHLVFRAFAWQFVVNHAVMLVLWLTTATVLIRNSAAHSRLVKLVLGFVMLALVGIGIDLFTTNPFVTAKFLRFYWFRMTDVMVPLGVSLLFVYLVQTTFEADDDLIRWRKQLAAWLTAISILAVLTNATVTVWQREKQLTPSSDWQGNITTPERLANWKSVCEWARTRTAPDARVFSLPGHQTFKWYASRSEVVNWKDIPQDAKGILEWYDRLSDARKFLWRAQQFQNKRATHKRLLELAEQYQFRYIILDRHRPFPQLDLPVSFANADYLVYDTQWNK